MEDDPMRRLSLSGGSDGERHPPMVPSCIPSIVDLPSRRHLTSSALLPPFHPMPICFNSSRGPSFFHYHVPPAPTPTAGDGGDGSHHMRSLLDVPFFSMDSISLPTYAHLGGTTVIPFTPSLVGFNQGLSRQPPLWVGHRRLQSDINVGFSQQNLQMPPSAPIKLEATMTEVHQSRGTTVTTPDDLVGSNMGPNMLVSSGNANQEQIESTENEANSMGGGDMPRHCRSLSMESFTTRNLDLGAVGQTMPNFQLPSTGEGVGGHGGSGSNGDHTALIDAKLGNGEFSEAEKKTITESESLSELVLTDPKKVKRILSNRRSAKRSKERKLKHKVALERKLQLLQMEISKLSQQLMMVQREFSGLLSQNNELKIRIQEMDRQRQMSDAIFEAMAAEAMQLVQVAFGDQFNYPHVPNGSQQQMSTQMIQLQQPQTQAQPSQTQQNQP